MISRVGSVAISSLNVREHSANTQRAPAGQGDLKVDDACVGPPGTKVLFWMTGVGVLAAKIQSTIDEDPSSKFELHSVRDKLPPPCKDAAVGSLLESPPGLIPFPSSTKCRRQILQPGVVRRFGLG